MYKRQTLHTVVELLLRDRSLAGSLYYDEFAQKMRKTRGLSEVLGKMAPDAAGDVVDDDLRALAFYLGREWRLDLKIATVADAVALWARNLSRNPVRERLDELADGWDGEKRLTTWLIEYCKDVYKRQRQRLALFHAWLQVREREGKNRDRRRAFAGNL